MHAGQPKIKFERAVWPCCDHCYNGKTDPHEPMPRPTHTEPCVFCGMTVRDAQEYQPPEEKEE